MKKCQKILEFLKDKKIMPDDEYNKMSLREIGTEETIDLKDGYLSYILSEDKTKCYISLTEHNSADNFILLDDYFTGYFYVETLNVLLNILSH